MVSALRPTVLDLRTLRTLRTLRSLEVNPLWGIVLTAPVDPSTRKQFLSASRALRPRIRRRCLLRSPLRFPVTITHKGFMVSLLQGGMHSPRIDKLELRAGSVSSQEDISNFRYCRVVRNAFRFSVRNERNLGARLKVFAR